MPNTPWSSTPLPGDLLLTRNNSFFGRLSVRYQQRRRHTHRNAAALQSLNFFPTHVAMMLDSGHVIHSLKRRPTRITTQLFTVHHIYEIFVSAVKRSNVLRFSPDQGLLRAARAILGHGVDIEPIQHFLQRLCWRDILLIRHTDVCELNKATEVVMSALVHLDKPYNPLIELRLRHKVRTAGGMMLANSVFCSQFIYEVFTESGISVPKCPPERVLPIDFLIWATDYGWSIRNGYDVFAAVSSYIKTQARSGQIDSVSSLVDQRRQIVRTIHGLQSLDRKLESIEKGTASLQQSLNVVPAVPAPDLWQKAGVKPLPISINVLSHNADRIRDHVLCDTPTAEERLSKFSWLVALAQNSDQRAVNEARNVINDYVLAISEAVLNSLDASVAEVVARLERQRKTAKTSQLEDGDDKGRTIMQALSQLTSIAMFFECSEDREAMEREMVKLEQRLKNLRVSSQEMLQALDAKQDGSLTDDRMHAMWENAEKYSTVMHAYAVAWDFANACIWIQWLGYRPTVENSIRLMVDNAPDAFMKVGQMFCKEIPRARLKSRQMLDRLHGGGRD